jgi:hypothetical protein
MRSYSLTAPGLWVGLEDWPHRACVDAVVTAMQTQCYSARSVYRFVQSARRFVAWRLETAGEAPPEYEEIERFAAHRRATAIVPNGERKDLVRLREALVQAGVITAPAATAQPIRFLGGSNSA